MDALKFLNEFKRMCKFYAKKYDCEGCPLYKEDGLLCNISELSYDERTHVLNLVEKWSKEHSERTYLSVLLEKFPKTNLENGAPMICPSDLGFHCDCISNCKECWNREYKE